MSLFHQLWSSFWPDAHPQRGELEWRKYQAWLVGNLVGRMQHDAEWAWLSKIGRKWRIGVPGFPVKLDGVGEHQAAFLDESRTRGRLLAPRTGNSGLQPAHTDGVGIERERAQQVPPHALFYLVKPAHRSLNPGHVDGLRDPRQFGRQINVAHQMAGSRMQQQQIFEQAGEGV